MIPSPAEFAELAESYQAPAAALLRDLVRIPSVNGRHPETPVAERILQEAERLGLKSKLVGQEASRLNVLVEAGRGPAGFAFIGHMDTVTEGDPDRWEHNPFAAETADGRIFGRGAADNKAGIACALFALALLRDHGLLDGDQMRFVLAGVVDEESGASSPLGVRYLLDSGALQARAAIYTYASDVICLGHRGLLRLRLRASGEAVHSGSPEWDRREAGANAVTGLAAVLLLLENLEIDSAPHPDFPGMTTRITPGTTIAGGDWEGMVPDWAEATVDIRLLPGASPDVVLEKVDAAVETACAQRPGLSVQVETRIRLPAAAIPADHPLVETARRYTQAITGAAWPAVGAGPANEGYMLIERGIPTLCGFGPTGGNAHAPNEWVSLASLAPTIAMFAGIAREYLENVKEVFDD